MSDAQEKLWPRRLATDGVHDQGPAGTGKCSIAFDCRIPAKRTQTRRSTPLQALNLLNSSFVMQQAGLFAKRLQNDAGESPHQITRAFTLCFNHSAQRLRINGRYRVHQNRKPLLFCAGNAE